MKATFDPKCVRWTVVAAACLMASCGGSGDQGTTVPDSIRQVMQKPAYQGATWSLLVADLDSGKVIYDLNSTSQVFIASVRKVFSTGIALNAIGSQHRLVTPVYREGTVAGGVLNGNLVMVASGDLTMGGRANRDGTIALTAFDHNEANALGNAVLTATDPLAGFDTLAAQVAASGITTVNGDVVIDDRLFDAFPFRDEAMFDVTPMLVNDDVVDMSFSQSAEGALLPFDYRPKSAAFSVQSSLKTGPASSAFAVALDPEPPAVPACFGQSGCVGIVGGTVPAGAPAPLTGSYPLIRTFRVAQPSTYARTVFIEALARAGVTVTAAPVKPNPVALLPAQGLYSSAQRVAQLTAAPYAQDIRFVNKVSYNIGADVTLLQFGLAKNGSRTMSTALATEQAELATTFNISPDSYHFIDGSGGGDTTAMPGAVIQMLRGMKTKLDYPTYVDSMPFLGVDGSLTTVTDFEADPTLAGAKGRVYAKTGTYVGLSTTQPETPLLKVQALAGYIDTKSGRRIVFFLAANNVTFEGFDTVLNAFQDEGEIAAQLWKLQ